MLKFAMVTLALCLGLVTGWAKTPPSVAEKVPAMLKHNIIKAMDYPQVAKDANLEGEVWLKLCVSEDAKLRILEISSSSPALGDYVKAKLSDISVPKNGCKADKPYYLKVRFDIL